MKIMIIDDETLICRYIKKLILDCSMGHEVVAAENSPVKALEIIRKKPPDLIFLDITMPQMDGLAALQEIKRISRRIEVIMLTCHDVFEYARSAMRLDVLDYVLKDEINLSRMHQILKKAQKAIDRRAKRKTALVYESSYDFACVIRENFERECVYETLANYNVYLDGDGIFFTMVCGYTKQNDAFLKTLVFAGVYHINLVNDDGTHIILIANSDKKDLYFADVCIQELKRYLLGEISGIIAISKPDREMAALFRVIKQTMNEYDETFYGRDYQAAGECADVHQIEKLMRDAVACAGSYELERLRRLIHKIIACCAQSGVDAYTLKHKLFGIVSFNSPAQETAFRKQKIMEAQDINALRAVLDDWCDELLKNTKDGRSQLIHDALCFIHQNYMHNITLTRMSEELHVNADYFSRKFKKEVGRNFSKFLQELRLDEAKKLLVSTDLPIMEVASRVGFQNDSYFSYAFKKALGCSPNDMRKY